MRQPLYLLGSSLVVATSLSLLIAARQSDRLHAFGLDGPVLTASQDARKQSCLTSKCHTEYQNLRHSHGPIVLGKCDKCHEPDEDSTPYESGDDHTFELLARDGELCLKCHEGQNHDAHVHNPISRKRCIGCHDPHGSQHPAMMRHEKLSDNCYECHEKLVEDDPHVHAPVALGQCTTCHDPHSAPHPKILKASGTDLCTSCHVEITSQLAQKTHAHRPFVEDCNQCHDPHDGQDTVRLRKKVPTLCLDCHQDVAKSVNHAAFKHGALEDERSCLRCHDPHTSNFGKQLREVPKRICLSCHDKAIVTKTGVIRDMKGFLERNKHHHGPIRDGDCGACHNPHGSEHKRILRKAYPPHFYAPFKDEHYKLCFSCHEKSLVHDAETTTLTGFRNGKKNLHFVHVNRETKGRTCRSCHDVHASNNPKHITDSVPFGPNWSYRIKFQKTETGGRCGAACHVSRGYDRIKPIDNSR